MKITKRQLRKLIHEVVTSGHKTLEEIYQSAGASKIQGLVDSLLRSSKIGNNHIVQTGWPGTVKILTKDGSTYIVKVINRER